MRIKFLGAAQTVTGSRTLIENGGGEKYLVDCGLFQGPKDKRLLNWEPFIDARSLTGVILTHAHLDHSGYIPKLVKEGLKGIIYSSEGTYDLCKILLRDAGRLQEEDAKFANMTGYSHHKPALPLYDEIDAISSLNLFHTVKRHEWVNLSSQLSLKLLWAGHIIGSSLVQLSFEVQNGRRLVTFSGDLGNGRLQTLRQPETITETDYLVLESTYGNRLQPRNNPEEELAAVINKVMERKGVLVIPAFSVGRTQEVLYLIKKLEESNRVPSVPVYLDSPLAQDATEIYLKHPEDHQLIISNGELTSPFCSKCYKTVKSPDESMILCMQNGPMIVLSAAGMLTGGRVLHHLKHRLPDSKNGVLFVGYQAEGTKGRLLQNGIKSLRIHHQEIPVEAEIFSIDSLSAHADPDDIIGWLKHLKKPPLQIFLNHGEKEAAEALAYRIFQEFGFKITIPEMGQEFKINSVGAETLSRTFSGEGGKGRAM